MPAYARGTIRRFLDDADLADTHAEKGRLFEDLVCYLFDKIPGLVNLHRNRKNAFENEEIDVAFWNEQHHRGLKSFNDVLLIECKNWSGAIGSRDVSWFLEKIRYRSLNFGILVAANGITGDADDGRHAHDLVSKALAEKIHLIVITRTEIECLASSDDLVRMIKAKVCQLVVSGTVWP